MSKISWEQVKRDRARVEAEMRREARAEEKKKGLGCSSPFVQYTPIETKYGY